MEGRAWGARRPSTCRKTPDDTCVALFKGALRPRHTNPAFPKEPFVAELTVSGSGTAGGTLHVEGTWQAPGPARNFKVSGALGGKQVAVRVPEA
jgi:hypothetical protein